MTKAEDNPYLKGRCFTWHVYLSVKQIKLIHKLITEASKTDKEVEKELKQDVQFLYDTTVGRTEKTSDSANIWS